MTYTEPRSALLLHKTLVVLCEGCSEFTRLKVLGVCKTGRSMAALPCICEVGLART
eukprot:m.457219 g.457219  ORF g.457219 m.457219 type:complete len:56 (+) comp21212_c0_seq1:2154-2321(+)